MNPYPAIVVAVVTTCVVAVVGVFHYEVIRWLNQWHCARNRRYGNKYKTRPTMLVTTFVLLAAHVAEIWLFGITFWIMLGMENFGTLQGYQNPNLLDCVYFSAANYTTVGWGDLIAAGDLRFLSGTEALVGFMMITWSASFSYLVMNRAWGDSARDD